MNNAEFVAHVRKETDEKPLTTELNFLRGALDRLEAAERRIEELEKRENAKVYCMKCGENVAYLGD